MAVVPALLEAYQQLQVLFSQKTSFGTEGITVVALVELSLHHQDGGKLTAERSKISDVLFSSPVHSFERYPTMTRLLFIQASPRGEKSKSVQIAQTYLDSLKEKSPALEVDILRLWETKLPAFDGDKVAAKINVMIGQEHDAVQKTAWDEVVEIASRFIGADRFLFAVPMWNGSIPYRLKQYIDIIHQPGLLWGLKPDTGYFGLLVNRHATLVLTSGAYAESRPSPAFGVDHQSTYLKAWLNQVGITAIDEIRVQPTLLTADPGQVLAEAKQAAVELAISHARA